MGLLTAVMAREHPKFAPQRFIMRESLRLSIKPEYASSISARQGGPCWTHSRRRSPQRGRRCASRRRVSRLQIKLKSRVVTAVLSDADGNSTAIRSDIVIGADGRQSTVAALVKASTYLNGQSATGYVYGYYEDSSGTDITGTLENVAAGVIPTNTGQHCVFVSVPAQPSGTFRGNVEGAFLRSSRQTRRISATMSSCARLIGPAWLRRRPRASQAVSRCRLGAGRRCWILQGPADGSGNNGRAQGRGTARRAILDGKRSRPINASATSCRSRCFHDTEEIASFRWNLDEVKTLHASLSASMQAECEYMAGLPAPVRREPQTRSGTSDRNATLVEAASPCA